VFESELEVKLEEGYKSVLNDMGVEWEAAMILKEEHKNKLRSEFKECYKE